jgi:kumamolisin
MAFHPNYSLLLAGVAALAMTPLAASAQTPAGFVEQAQSVTPLTAEVQVLGAANALSTVNFQIALALRDRQGLQDSNRQGKRLKSEDLALRRLPTQRSYDAVLNWLQAQGLTVEKTSRNRMTIHVSGTVGEVSRALRIKFSRVHAEGESYVSATTAPSTPAELSDVILSINGLQPHLKARKLGIVQPLSTTAPPLFPAAFVNAYRANGLGSEGANTTTAIIIDTFPRTSDLTQFWTTTGTAQSLSNITFIQAVPGKLPKPSGEESMDVQTASSVAPQSKVRVYASRTLSFSNLDTTFERVIQDMEDGVAITQISISLGACETSVPAGQANTDDGYFAVMAAMGASIFVSSGDSGSLTCGGTVDTPSFFSTSPNVTAVGGTTLKLKGAGTVKSETGWSGSGGGVSVRFTKPFYQSALPGTQRLVPDISADADPGAGALVIVKGVSQQIGGTSLSAPILAGLAARINSARLSAGKAPIGLFNARIYSLTGTANFRDITSGDNGGFTAGPGHDLVTGLGAPLLDTLLPTLVAQP